MRNLLELFEGISDALREVGVDPYDLMDNCQDAVEKAESVRVCGAHQPSWPLAENLTSFKIMAADGEEEPEFDFSGDVGEQICWVVLNGHPHDMSPYAPNSVFSEW